MPDDTGQRILDALRAIREDQKANSKSIWWMRGHQVAQWALILLMASKVFGK